MKSYLYSLIAVTLLAGGCDQQNPSNTTAPTSPQTNGTAVAKLDPPTNAVKEVSASAESSTTATNAEKEESVKAPPPPPFVSGFSGDLESFEIQFSDTPDLNRIREYLVVTPNPGPLTSDYWAWCKKCLFRGDLKPQTTYQVVVKPGLPMADGRVTVREFRRTFKTGDCPPSISFAETGRYLPPAGKQALVVKATNVSTLKVQTRSVPTRNIVQILAREERCYDSYYGGGGDSDDTAELADEPTTRTIKLPKRVNEEVAMPVSVRAEDGSAAKGVYLLSVEKGDRKDDEASLCKWRLVCVTDIGLSVREAGNAVYVWTTSLVSGQPTKGIRVRVYSSAHVLLGEGVTDAEGWCCCEVPENAATFAVVATSPNEQDVSFLSLRKPLDETIAQGSRRGYVKKDGSEAFVWTERGIYRPDEPIFVQAILRNGEGNAPRPFPVQFVLRDPDGKVFKQSTKVTDPYGSAIVESFKVPSDQPCGLWTIHVRIPGDEGEVLGTRTVKIEEFVPPQIRVKVQPSDRTTTTNFAFTVSAEHLYGGPAKGLPVEGAVMFEDAPFAPKGWEAFRFGDENRRLNPNFTVLDKIVLDAAGEASFTATFPENGRPRAAVKATVQGSVFESGGRPASSRATQELHFYPYYIGVQLPDMLRQSPQPKVCRVVLVRPDGAPYANARKLTVRFERIEYVYGLKQRSNGYYEWTSDKVRYPLGDDQDLMVGADGSTQLKVPVSSCGDYAVSIRDAESDVSFGTTYWVGGGDDDGRLRASLDNPSRVKMSLDKPLYYPGDRPRLTVKAPFAGSAWLSVMRDDMVYSQVVTLTNATAELVLEPVTKKWTPGVDVGLSVVQACTAGRKHFANRAFGVVPLRAATRDSALEVKVFADVHCSPDGGSKVQARVETKQGDVSADRAIVTVVDEGILMLTDEKTPDPVGWFGETRDAFHPFYDLFNYLLPIVDGSLKRSGVKTGGGADSDLFRRVSPMPSRRFKPLSLWKKDIELLDGAGSVTFDLPEFVGEVRVTAVAYNRRGTGTKSLQKKVAPNLVMQPDAPRFVAPGDQFEATMTLSNRSGQDGKIVYDVIVSGGASLARPAHAELALANDASETLRIPVTAGAVPGEAQIVFITEGLGEKHKSVIDLPVRPGAAWQQRSMTVCLAPGEMKEFSNPSEILPESAQRMFRVSGSPLADLTAALDYLARYPYGCLEQTTSQVFPLVSAGGILNTLPIDRTSVAADAKNVVEAGIDRVVSMLRANDFTMWPDCDHAPWDKTVSNWAAHFLVEADKAGFKVPSAALTRVKGFLRRWAMSQNPVVSIYACQTLALLGTPDLDRMLYWYDQRTKLKTEDCCRLARAFVRSGDRARARDLLASVAPENVVSASCALLALLDLDPTDARVEKMVAYLNDQRAAKLSHWGTTKTNAHALMALGAYFRTRPQPVGLPDVQWMYEGQERPIPTKKSVRLVGGGTVKIANRGTGAAYVTASALIVPSSKEMSAESSGIQIRRRYFLTSGDEADLTKLVRGDLLIVETTLVGENRSYEDLVVEDLLPGCFEPDTSPISVDAYPWIASDKIQPWVLRKEARDDRMLLFSRPFKPEEGKALTAYTAVRVVSAGEFLHPGVSVEAMYEPQIHARTASARIKIEK